MSDIILSYALGGIVLWISDLGSSYWMVLQISSGHLRQLRIEWTYRFIRLFLSSILVGIVLAVTKHELAYAFLFFSCLWDLDSDSGVSLRQVLFSAKNSILIQLAKKASQLVPLLLMDYSGSSNLYTFSSILLIPVLSLKILEVKEIGGFSFRRLGAREGKTFSMWLQGGYSILLGFDVFVLDYLGLDSLVVSVALGKKIATALFILGSTLSIETLAAFSKSVHNQSRSLTLHSELKRTFIASLCISLFVIVSLHPILKFFNFKNSEVLSMSVLYTFILSPSFSSISAFWNSILVARRKFLYSGIQGYCCSIVYLVSIIFFGYLFNFEIGVGIAICLKMITEIFFGWFFIRKLNQPSSLNTFSTDMD